MEYVSNRKMCECIRVDMCMLCGEIWNSANLIAVKIKDKNLNLCPDCLRDFDEEFTRKSNTRRDGGVE